jgi:hypothetical protein
MAKSSLSPTQRTIRALKDQGRVHAVVERFLAHAGPHGLRQDAFGLFDVIAIDTTSIVGIQCTSGACVPDHRRAILENEYAPLWIGAGGAIELWGWRKLTVKRGGKQKRWAARVIHFTMEDFE